MFWLSFDNEAFLDVLFVIFVISIAYCVGLGIISVGFEKKNFSTLPYTTSRAIFFEKFFFWILNDSETLSRSEFNADSEYVCLRS